MADVHRVPKIKIIKFLAPLFFANCSTLKYRIMAELNHRHNLAPRQQFAALVLCFASVSTVDTTALQMLEDICQQCHDRGIPLLIASPNALVETKLHSSGVVRKLGGRGFVFRRVHEAVRAILLGTIALPFRTT
jgi:MFS superfamily sulfate permease-like transporter